MALDDAQRTVIGGIGVFFFTAGPLGWIIGGLSIHWRWPMVVFPALAMWLLGLVLLVWAMRSGRGWRSTVKRMIGDGELLSTAPLQKDTVKSMSAWSRSARDWLARENGVAVSTRFVKSADGRPTPGQAIGAQVEFLKSLRKRDR